MTPKNLKTFLKVCLKNKFNILITGQPGIGKSDIVEQVAKEEEYGLILTHPVVSDPTDYKGMPFVVDGEAVFLPFNDLKKLIDAKGPTICFIDDLGQAMPSVQASVMQLLLARKINNTSISDSVVFIAATNRKEDRAGVSGLLEPVKSRFTSIIELEISAEDWCEWALKRDIPLSLISFIKYKPTLLSKFTPTNSLINSPSPRTVANVGKLMLTDLPKECLKEAVKGAVGEAFAIEYFSFLEIRDSLPRIEEIVLSPLTIKVPDEISIKYSLLGYILENVTDDNIEALLLYIGRLGNELEAIFLFMLTKKMPNIQKTPQFINWVIKNHKTLW